jgi:DNA-directed RNA polymerase specialized sigma subunit
LDGELHRVDAPAVILTNGQHEWWINDQIITKEVEAWIIENNIVPWNTWTDADKLIFRMKYFQELKYEEISEILGTTVGGLKASYFHAVKKIEAFVVKD